MIPNMNPAIDFNTAFATARQRGAKAFLWRGRTYHTRRSDDPPEPAEVQPLIVGWVDPDPAVVRVA